MTAREQAQELTKKITETKSKETEDSARKEPSDSVDAA